MSDILQQIADNLGVGSYPPSNNSYLYAIADYYGVDTTSSKDLMADILDSVGGNPSTSSDYLKDIVLALGGTVTINGNWMEAWLAITAPPPAFAFTVKTDNTGVSTSTQFQLPLTTSAGLNIVVDWGDATTSTITSHLDVNTKHTYASASTYSISITGTLPGFQFNNAGDKLKILNISNWGVLDITTNGAFRGCTNLTCSATDAPTITTTDLTNTFNLATSFNGAIGNWDVSGVNNMAGMFASATAFNQDISTWDTSTVTNMVSMFQSATAFDQNLGSWDVANVTNFFNFMRGKTAATFSTANLDAIYNGWSASGVQPNCTISFQGAQYTVAGGQAGKNILLAAPNNWTIIDGGGI
jgi:surface protein